MAGRKFRLPVPKIKRQRRAMQPIENDELVGSPITPFQHTLELFIGPGIQINGLDPTNVCAHSTVNARAPNADEDTQVP